MFIILKLFLLVRIILKLFLWYLLFSNYSGNNLPSDFCPGVKGHSCLSVVRGVGDDLVNRGCILIYWNSPLLTTTAQLVANHSTQKLNWGEIPIHRT